MFPYERAVSRFLFGKVLRSYRVMPRWLYRRLLYGFPTFIGFVFRSIRMVVGFTLLTPFLLWPPAWPMLAASWERARREAERRRRWEEDDD
jgi:hypothetical protein